MDDLIYNFLLQSDYPRASIILNVEVVGSAICSDSGNEAPAFIIVEPETADVLAVIDVASSLSDEMLEERAGEVRSYAHQLAGNYALGFLFCVDPHGSTEQEQVRIYRLLRNARLQQLSMQNFPDFNTLRVSRKLAIKTSVEYDESLLASTASTGELQLTDADVGLHDLDDVCGKALYSYLLALVLLIAIVADRILMMYLGESLLTTAQSVLTIGAAVLFTVPSSIRCVGQALVKCRY